MKLGPGSLLNNHPQLVKRERERELAVHAQCYDKPVSNLSYHLDKHSEKKYTNTGFNKKFSLKTAASINSEPSLEIDSDWTSIQVRNVRLHKALQCWLKKNEPEEQGKSIKQNPH